jgi:N4-gp56 family major capsid protein
MWATDSKGSNLAQAYLTKYLRTVAQPLTRFRQVCDVKEAIGKHRGDTFNWDIISNVATAGAALTEEATMPATNFLVTKGTCTVTEYGNSIPFTRKLLELSQHDLKGIVRTALANDMAKVLDQTIAEIISDNVNLVYGAASGTHVSNIESSTDGIRATAHNATAPLTYSHVIKIVDDMKEKNIPTFDGENYVCIAHPSTLTAMRTALVSVNQYTESGYKKILNGEIGKFGGMRFVEQTNVSKVTPTNAGAGSWAFFFGGEAVIEAMSVPEEVVIKEITDYGRSLGLAWYAILGFGLAWSQATIANARIACWWPNASAVADLDVDA